MKSRFHVFSELEKRKKEKEKEILGSHSLRVHYIRIMLLLLGLFPNMRGGVVELSICVRV